MLEDVVAYQLFGGMPGENMVQQATCQVSSLAMDETAPEMLADSVLRKRKHKMNKHKHKYGGLDGHDGYQAAGCHWLASSRRPCIGLVFSAHSPAFGLRLQEAPEVDAAPKQVECGCCMFFLAPALQLQKAL